MMVHDGGPRHYVDCFAPHPLEARIRSPAWWQAGLIISFSDHLIGPPKAFEVTFRPGAIRRNGLDRGLGIFGNFPA